MTKGKNHQKPANIHIFAVKIFFGIVMVLMFLFVLIGELVFPDERDEVNTRFQVFEADWEQLLENGERIPAQVPGTVPAEYGEVISLSTTLPQEIYDGEMLCFHTIWQDVYIYIDGELRQSYNTQNSRPFGLSSTFRYVFVELNKEDAGREMVYQFSSNSKYAGNMRTCYIGDKMSIWLFLIEQYGMRTVIALFLLLMSFFCVLVCFILKWVYKKMLPLYYLAWAIFLCAVWMLSEIGFRQLVVKNVSILTNCTYWSLMLIPIPMLLYINEVQKEAYRKWYLIPMIYSVIISVVGTVLQVLNRMEFVQQLPFIHFGVIMSIGMMIVTITMDVFRKRISEYLPVGIGIYGLLLTAVMEMFFYYVGVDLTLGMVLVIGLLFLLIMAIIKTGQDLLASEKKKQQVIFAREAQTKFLANMSHEIRTPINAVIGMNEMILRESENEAILEYAGNIQSASNMLLGLVNDILDFTKIEAGQLELVEDTYNPAALLQDEMLLLNTRAMGKPISTQLEIDETLPSGLFGDELRIKQVLTNLISNAVKYTKEGSITLKVFYTWLDDEQVELELSVVDTGIGIMKEDIPKLFISFKRLELNKNRNVEGTGLGLNIVSQLVELMQGTISVESEYGKGSVFTVRIPQRVIDKKPVGSIEVVRNRRRKGNKPAKSLFKAPKANVLVVDDNSINLAVIKGLLKRTEVGLDLAASGRECLELTRNKYYDIILMDHMMPDMDGVETLQMLRSDEQNPNRNTVVIALTANAIAGCREMYLEYGFNDYISKPIQVEKLEESIMQHLPDEIILL